MIGQVIGPYKVVASIGRGGMGEVFKGHDQKLNRDVALKILPPELAKDPERLARFQREARVLASLQHQNIAAIYGLEEAEGQPVLAMELAGGEDLSVRLERGPLPENEIDKITCQLARGLEYAHEQGIVHRDLKPANVKVSGEGAVKILDFGLARAFTADSVAEGEAESHSYQPTITQALTGSGTVLGTAAYMSPEQARGYEVDRRGDIWAFGVILYEMLTGERLFEGETATDTLAAVLHKEPAWDELEGKHPALLLQICRRCLEKDAKQRLRDIGEVRVALEGTGATVIGLSPSGLGIAPAGVAPARSNRLPWLAAGVLALVALGAVVAGVTGKLGPQLDPWPMVQSAVNLPEGMSLDLLPTEPGSVQVSPDGQYLCFAGVDSTGRSHIVIRHLAEGWYRVLNGTQSAAYLFWSADSREIGYYAGGSLWRAPINGGPALAVVPASNAKGGSWNQFDEILYAPTHTSSIFMVPATGGDPVEMTDLKQDEDFRSHRLPQWLPDGRHFQYVAVSRNPQSNLDCVVRIVEAATGQSTDLTATQTNAMFAEGHLIYPHDGVLMARPLSADMRSFTASAFPVISGVAAVQAAHLAAFAVGESGVLAYSAVDGGMSRGRLVRYSATGELVKDMGPIGAPLGMYLSPDGRHLCLSLADDRTGTFDLWQLDMKSGLSTRLTFESESEWAGIYAPDGKSLIVLSDRPGHASIYRVSTTGGGALEPLVVNKEDNYPGAFTPDGQSHYFTAADSTATLYLSVLDLESGAASRVHPGVSYAEGFPAVSPDGKLLAYTSSQTGDQEIFIEMIDQPEAQWRVSASGGNHARWSPAGDVLYFFDGAQAIVSVPVEIVAGGLNFGAAEPILTGLESSFTSPYDVDQSTGDLVTIRPLQDGKITSLQLVTGWQQLLQTD